MPKITLQEISGGITIASALPASATNANKIPLLNTLKLILIKLS